MKLYVAGPMTGLPEFNLPAFAEATARLNAKGYEAINPGRRGGTIEGYVWSDYLRLGLADLVTCEGVALLHGWWNSKGAQLEQRVALDLGMVTASLEYWLTQGGLMRLPDGTEAILTLELPLSLTVVGVLGPAITGALKGIGYTDVVLLTDGTNRIVATPPPPEEY